MGNARLDSNLTDDLVIINGQQYKLKKNLGAGKRGVVFLAQNTLTGEKICIKKETSHERASIETAAINQCYQPHKSVVSKNGNNYYYSQPFFTGQTLKSIRDSLTLYEKIVVAQKLKNELERLHTLGYLHRDLKSDNIIVDVSGPEIQVHIIDLGRSVHRKDREHLFIDETRARMLFQDHTAPEYLSGGKIGKGADIYSYGKVLKALFPGQATLTEKLISKSLEERKVGFKLIEDELTTLFQKQKSRVLLECDVYVVKLRHSGLSELQKSEVIGRIQAFRKTMALAGFDQSSSVKNAQKEFAHLKSYLRAIIEVPRTFLQRVQAFFHIFAPPSKSMMQWLESKASQFLTSAVNLADTQTPTQSRWIKPS